MSSGTRLSSLVPSASPSKANTYQDPKAQYMRTILKWRNDPVAFVKEVFGVKMAPWQERDFKRFADPKTSRMAIRAGRGVGKSAWLSWVILWWHTTRYPAKTACTAPTAHQLEDVLWGELGTWLRKMPPALRMNFNLKRDKLEVIGIGNESFAVARTARKESPESLQGFHSESMLFVIDEASAVDDLIYEVGEGSMSTPGAKTIMVGNPNRTSGYFHDAFHKNRDKWVTSKVSCLDSLGPFASTEYPASVASRYGVESNTYRVHVLGEFPRAEDDVVMPLDLVESAVDRDVSQHGKVVWGLDVARYGGDRTALAKRHGNTVKDKIQFWRGLDTMQTTGKVAAMFKETPDSDKPYAIFVDVIGIGAGVVDRLKELGLPVVGINVAESPAVRDKYARLRDELWFRAREWFDKRDVKVISDDELIAELTLPKYKVLSSGKIKVESKDEMKKRGVVSCDLADSLCLTFADSIFAPQSSVYREIETVRWGF